MDNNVEKCRKYVVNEMQRKLQSGFTNSVAVLVSEQGVQNGSPHFQFMRFEGAPIFSLRALEISELLFMIVFLVWLLIIY